jgi:hypothetical protein
MPTQEEINQLPPDPGAQRTTADEAGERFAMQKRALEETAMAERQKRLYAEQHAIQRAQEAHHFRGEAASAEYNLLSTALSSVARERDTAKRELQRAMESGEWDKVAEAQDALSIANATLVQYERDRQAIDPSRNVQPTSGRVAPAPQQQQVDPVEAFIGSATPQTQSWLRQNRQFVQVDGRGIPKLDSRVMALHYAAESSGIQPDTPDYFRFIEERLQPQQQQQQQRRQGPVSAPVYRDPPGYNGQGRQVRMTLTPEQAQFARESGDPKKTPREREIAYWQNLQELKSEGRIGNTQH